MAAMKTLVELLLSLAGVHLACGTVFTAVFHRWGLHRMDAGAQGTGPGFRLLITPGIIALWPLLAVRWWRLAPGTGFLGDAETPVSPRRLRALHGLAWKALAVLAPLAVAAALWWRPAEFSGSRITVKSSLAALAQNPALKP